MAYNNINVINSMRVNDSMSVQCIRDGDLRSFHIKTSDTTIPLFNVHYTSMTDDDVECKLYDIATALSR